MSNTAPKDTSGTRDLPPYIRKSLKSGLINVGAVGENDMPDTAVLESINFHFDSIGSAKLRKGLTQIGNNLGSAVLGMHYHVDTIGTPSGTQLIVVAGTAAYYLSGASFVSVRAGLTLGSKARFVTYLNYAFMVNGTEPTMVWDGLTSDGFTSTGNASGAPNGTLIENFRSRLWIAGNAIYPDRVYYSTIPSATTVPVVSWATAPDSTGQWIDISPSDGDTITALQRFRTVMVCFKTNHIYRIFDVGQIDADPYYAVGTSSQESVVETKVGIFFHHSSGFYQYNIYGIVQEISRPIWDIIRAIPTSTYPNVAGWLEADQDHICWAIGSVTVNGVAYTNLVVRYTISTQTWTHYSYYYPLNFAIRHQPFYTDTVNQYAVVGDSLGNVFEANIGFTDAGKPIQYSLIHRWENIDGLLSTRKNLETANFSHYGGAGSTVSFQDESNDPDNLLDWSRKADRGQLGTVNTGFNSMSIKARKFRFRISGQSTGDPFTYNGYELLGVKSQFIQFDPS